MNIRTAERRDLSAMLDIYNYEVKNGTATFDVEPRAGAAGEAWFAAHNTGNHPLLVAEEDGKVLGYASLSPYRDFDAYLQTVELSVYVAPESRGRGIARTRTRTRSFPSSRAATRRASACMRNSASPTPAPCMRWG